MRGEGTTTRQMLQAPLGALYVWINSNLRYPQQLARNISRPDLKIVGPDWFIRPNWRGREYHACTVDHAVEFSDREYTAYLEFYHYNKFRRLTNVLY